MSNFRWVICGLLFLATTINYMDRQVLSLTWKDFIAPDFHWTDDDYGTITGLFSVFYAVANLFAGKFIDWMGTKKGYLIAIFVWSVGACMHAACGWGAIGLAGGSIVALTTISVWLFLACRMILAVGEAGNFPAAIKVTAEYFPKKDRAFATSRTVPLPPLYLIVVLLWAPWLLLPPFPCWLVPADGRWPSSSLVCWASSGWVCGHGSTKSLRATSV